MIEIIEGHDCSSYFWIMPVKFEYDKIDKNNPNIDYWNLIDEFKDKEISIEEGDVDNFLYYFLKKHFDKSFIPNIKRDEIRKLHGECIEQEPIFEWYLEYNFYSFEEIEMMINDINETIELLINDYDNKKLDKLREGFSWLAYLDTENTLEISKEKTYEYAKEHKNEIIEFYKNFINYLKDMIKTGKENGYNLISFMGP